MDIIQRPVRVDQTIKPNKAFTLYYDKDSSTFKIGDIKNYLPEDRKLLHLEINPSTAKMTRNNRLIRILNSGSWYFTYNVKGDGEVRLFYDTKQKVLGLNQMTKQN